MADGGWRMASRLLETGEGGPAARGMRADLSRYVDRYEDEGLQGAIDKHLEQVSHQRAPVDEVIALVERYRATVDDR